MTRRHTPCIPDTTNLSYSYQKSEVVPREKGEMETEHTSQDRPQLSRKMGGRLSVHAMNFGLPTTHGTVMHATDNFGKNSWQYRVLDFLHSQGVQLALILLLLLDVCIIFTELFLLAQFPSCHTIGRDAISCCPVVNEADDVGLYEHFCEAGLEPSFEYKAGCDEHKWKRVHTAEEVMFALTLIILFLFLIELNVTMIALKPCIFFRQFFFLVDYVIVTMSVILELTFHFLHEEVLQSLIALLVAARVWRFIRIGHGIVEATNELAHRSFEQLLSYTEELEQLLRDNGIAVPESARVKEIKHEDGDYSLLSEIEREHRTKLREALSFSATPEQQDK
jgi:hypothetical protein